MKTEQQNSQETASRRACELCPNEGNVCTNGRCMSCHAGHCTPGGNSSPGHGRRRDDGTGEMSAGHHVGALPTAPGFYWRRQLHHGDTAEPGWRWAPAEVYKMGDRLMSNGYSIVGPFAWGPRIEPPPEPAGETTP